jgi:hemin uptake protein HemP
LQIALLLTYAVQNTVRRHDAARPAGRLRAKDWHVTSGRDDTREAGRPPPVEKPLRLKVSEIMEGEREAILEHDGQEYRLRITASGKLILTK